MDKEEALEKIKEMWKMCNLDQTDVLVVIGRAMDCHKCPARKICYELGSCRGALLKYLGYEKEAMEFTMF